MNNYHQTVRLYEWFLRVVAIFLLFFALRYWMRLTGVFGDEQWRFDTMTEHWRFASSILAVAMPVAALGLWGRFSWGVAVWFPVMAAEVTMHGFLPELFGSADLLLAFHAACLLLFAVFQGALWFYGRRQRKS